MTELIGLDRISVQFNLGGGGWFGAKPRVLHAAEEVSFTIGEGETLGLVGESGSGKSTLGNVVAGLQEPTSGALRFRGKALDAAGWLAARREIQIVFQDPFGALDPRMAVSDIISEPLRIQRLGNQSQRRARAAELVERVGLPADALNRYPHEFSGGQRQRIAIARALAPEPRLIVADEPLSALDVSIQSQVLNLMKELQEQHGLSYLFISHDLAVVHHLVDRVAVLYLGRLVELAPRNMLFAHPSHPYTQALLESVPRIGHRRNRGRTIKGEMPSPLAPPPGGIIGMLVGVCSGYFGGRLDSVLMRFTDGVITLPLLPLLIVLGALDLTKLGFSSEFAHSGAAGFWRIVIIIAIVDWTGIARIVRAATLAVKERDFVRAARASGAGTGYVMASHVLPNVATPIIVAFTLTVGRVILFESVLSFLGFGVVPPTPSWGNMLNNAQELVTTAPALAVYPGLLIFITVIAVNFLGDGLQHAFDPRSER